MAMINVIKSNHTNMLIFLYGSPWLIQVIKLIMFIEISDKSNKPVKMIRLNYQYNQDFNSIVIKIIRIVQLIN